MVFLSGIIRTLAISASCGLFFLSVMLFSRSPWVELPHLLAFGALWFLGWLGGRALSERLLPNGPPGPTAIRVPLTLILQLSIWLAAGAASWALGSVLILLRYWLS